VSLTRRQLELRADAIGGSEIAALAKLSRWATPIEIYEAKILGTEKPQTLAMELGHLLEEPVAKIYQRRTSTWLRVVHSLKSPRYPFAVATPDRAVFLERVGDLVKSKKLGLSDFRRAERGLECKTTGWRQKHRWGDEGSDQVPDEYAVQCLWGMGVSELRAWDLAALFDRDDFKIYRLVFDAETFEGLYEIAARFMVDHVIPRVPPPVDASDQYADFLSRAWKTNQVEPIAAGPELERLAVELAKLVEVERRVELAKQARVNQLKLAIADAGGLQSPVFGKILWRRSKARKLFDGKAAARELLDLTGLVLNALPAGELRESLTARRAEIILKNTRELEGNRPFRPYWSPALLDQVKSLGAALELLENVRPESETQAPSDGGTVEEEQTGEVQP
jgi:putative phage-type endonuclease